MNSPYSSGRPQLIAIVGGSGAGKSWLARQLQRRLGKEAAHLCLDDFYRDRSGLSLARRARLNFDHPRSIDWPVLDQVLRECQAGRWLRRPSYDFKSHSRRAPLKRWKPKRLVLVEGLWLLRNPLIRRRFAFSIFVTCPRALRLRRRLRRDTAERARSATEVRRQFREQVMPMHERFVAPQEHWASITVRSPLPSQEIGRLIDMLRSLGNENNSMKV